MEQEWEDPGLAFLTIIYGIIKKNLFNINLDPYKDPYIIELIISIFIVTFSINKLRYQPNFWSKY